MRGVAGGRSQLTAIAVTGERKEVEPFLKEAKNRVAAKSSIGPVKKAA